jgi:hypothetical protein
MKEAALILVALMLTYFALVNHVSLRPWNNLSATRPQLRSTMVGLVPALLVIIALLRGQGLTLASVWLWVWLLLQIRQWWVPYWLGPTRLHKSFEWYSAGGYDHTLRFLHPPAGRPAPDWQHVVLQALTLLAAVAVTLQAAGSRPTPS